MRDADEPLLLHFQAKRRKELPGVAFPTFHGGSNSQPGIFADVRLSWEGRPPWRPNHSGPLTGRKWDGIEAA
jgi:hypothetical protein